MLITIVIAVLIVIFFILATVQYVRDGKQAQLENRARDKKVSSIFAFAAVLFGFLMAAIVLIVLFFILMDAFMRSM